MTGWVALGLRIFALWLGWHACKDLYAAFRIYELDPINGPGMPLWVAKVVSDTGLTTNLTIALYQHCALLVISKLAVGTVCWVFCRQIANVMTHGLDKLPPETPGNSFT
jgi:hypothetical protein